MGGPWGTGRSSDLNASLVRSDGAERTLDGSVLGGLFGTSEDEVDALEG